MKIRDYGIFWEHMVCQPLIRRLQKDAQKSEPSIRGLQALFAAVEYSPKQVSEPAIPAAATKDAKMTEQRMEWIKRRAYSLWEEAGRPHGRDQEHWNQAAAERETLERTKASSDGKDVLIKLFQSKSPANEALKTPPSRKSARAS